MKNTQEAVARWKAAGVNVLSGYALFFHQGIDAFQHFTGRRPAELDRLRRLLDATET